ncbi:hypothetical protein [Psychrobacter aquimaris]|uniref:hypothetical protein n=1 Tax=Psychrobacter aquimaris TaxID=292733 RepID=UPI0039C5DA46
MSKYIAKQSVGRFRLGEEVEGLTADRAKFLLAEGAIEEVKDQEKSKIELDAEAEERAIVKDDAKPKAKPKAAAKDKD